MSSNRDLAARFHEAAAILEITGANAFKVNALARVARVLEDMPTEIAPIADDLKALQALDGIGKSSAEKIKEFVETGSIKEFDELRESIPAGLIDVLDVPGLGPKTVKVLWEKGGVTDIESLKSKIDSGELEKIPRMGAKTLANIRDAIDFAERSSGRMRLGQALPLAEAIVARHLQCQGRHAHRVRRQPSSRSRDDRRHRHPRCREEPGSRDEGACRTSRRREGAPLRRDEDERATRCGRGRSTFESFPRNSSGRRCSTSPEARSTT